MWCCNDVHAVMTYGTSAYYKAAPSPEQRATGVVPLDSLPAAWWNCMWCDTNSAINEARDAIGSFIDEVNTLLTNAGIQPNCNCVDTIYRAVNKIRQTVGDAVTAGAVKSSSNPSEVSIDATGIMSVNCLGNAASLTTTARTVVGAVNELKSTYDCCFTDTATALGGKAPTSHASSTTTYGVGTASDYGHLKISDQYTSVLAACEGVAASQLAVACVYQIAAASSIAYYNYAGRPETCGGTAGTSSCVARGDHTHPYPLHNRLSDFSLHYLFNASFSTYIYCTENYKFAPADYWSYRCRADSSGGAETICVDQYLALSCLCLNPAYAEEGTPIGTGAGEYDLAPYAFCPNACGRLTWRLEMPLFCVYRGTYGQGSGTRCGDITVINCFEHTYLHVEGKETHSGNCSSGGSGDKNVYLPPGCCVRVCGWGTGGGITGYASGGACVTVSAVRFTTCPECCSCACANNAAWRDRLLHHVGMISN